MDEKKLSELEAFQRSLLELADRPRIPAEVLEAQAKLLGRSRRTLQRRLKRFRASGDPTALGELVRGRTKGKPVIEKAVERVLSESIGRYYARKQKPSLSAVYRNVVLACQERKLTPPALNTFISRVRQADQLTLVRRREGRDKAFTLTPIQGRQPPAEYPLHIVQMDHTEADIILVDREHRRPIGRPTLGLAIDIYSRCIAGYYVGFDAASAATVSLCVANIATDKNALLARHQIEGIWPLNGKPTILHTDNGSEFANLALRRGCVLNGIRLEHRPVDKKHYGGTIERVIGTMMTKIHDELPGTTFSNVQQRGEYDSEGQAVLTLEEFERWLLLSIVEYHAEEHSSLGEPPLSRLQYGLTLRMPPAVANPAIYSIDFLPSFERQIQRDGFHLDHMCYRDGQLDHLIAHRKVTGEPFELRRDPRDISRVWVKIPDEHRYLEIPFRDRTHPAMSLWELKEALNVLQENRVRQIDERTIVNTIRAKRELIRQASLKTKRARRNSERLAVLGDQAPLPSRPPPLPPAKERTEPLKPFEVDLPWK